MKYNDDRNFFTPLEDGIIYEAIEDDNILSLACYNYSASRLPLSFNHKNTWENKKLANKKKY